MVALAAGIRQAGREQIPGRPQEGAGFEALPDPFAGRMNAVPKLVASRTLTQADTTAWANSRVLAGDVIDAVQREPRDVVVTGSLSLVRRLTAGDLIDEYRLLTFPTVLGKGDRLFPADGPHSEWECLSADKVGAAVLTRHRKAARRQPASWPCTRRRPTPPGIGRWLPGSHRPTRETPGAPPLTVWPSAEVLSGSGRAPPAVSGASSSSCP
ncbi:dihydrofolate reductase family protein [Streptomyces sp. NPDC001500]